MPTTLTDLPAELRNEIYHIAIADEEVNIIDERGITHAEPALLRTCKQIRAEAKHFVNNGFKLNVTNRTLGNVIASVDLLKPTEGKGKITGLTIIVGSDNWMDDYNNRRQSRVKRTRPRRWRPLCTALAESNIPLEAINLRLPDDYKAQIRREFLARQGHVPLKLVQNWMRRSAKRFVKDLAMRLVREYEKLYSDAEESEEEVELPGVCRPVRGFQCTPWDG